MGVAWQHKIALLSGISEWEVVAISALIRLIHKKQSVT